MVIFKTDRACRVAFVFPRHSLPSGDRRCFGSTSVRHGTSIFFRPYGSTPPPNPPLRIPVVLPHGRHPPVTAAAPRGRSTPCSSTPTWPPGAGPPTPRWGSLTTSLDGEKDTQSKSTVAAATGYGVGNDPGPEGEHYSITPGSPYMPILCMTW